MARMIDADALQELCNKRIKDTWNSKTAPVSWAEAYADFKDDIDSIPALTPPNKPLTLEKLREMDGQPAWCEDAERWVLITVENAGSFKDIPFALFEENGARFEWNVEGRELSLYSYPPAQQRWIPVSERLPERRRRVLCWLSYPDTEEIIVENQYYGNGMWMVESEAVTHWMPLPEPPEED